MSKYAIWQCTSQTNRTQRCFALTPKRLITEAVMNSAGRAEFLTSRADVDATACVPLEV